MHRDRCLGALSRVATALRAAHTRTCAKLACVDPTAIWNPDWTGPFGKFPCRGRTGNLCTEAPGHEARC